MYTKQLWAGTMVSHIESSHRLECERENAVGDGARKINRIHIIPGLLNHVKKLVLYSEGSGKSSKSFQQEYDTTRFAF